MFLRFFNSGRVIFPHSFHEDEVEITWKVFMKYGPVASAFCGLVIHEIQSGRACFARLYSFRLSHTADSISTMRRCDPN